MTAAIARPYRRILGRKQSADNDLFRAVWMSISNIVPGDYVEALLDATVAEIQAVCAGKQTAYCWSGGKDSIALEIVCERAGISECVMGISELEYPDFLAWVTDHMPWGLEVINTGQDMDWLAEHADMLFPQDNATAAKWFKIIQHRAQRQYFRDRQLDVIILGRRHADSNFTGHDGTGIYTSLGVTRYSPIRRWTHEDVLALIHYTGHALPPIYDWPNGWVVGTGAWAARQWTGSVANAWHEVWQIDRRIVMRAAEYFESARLYLAV